MPRIEQEMKAMKRDRADKRTEPERAVDGAADRIAAVLVPCPDMLAALKDSRQRIEQLCGMVNYFSVRLGLGNKVRAEDWSDRAVAAIQKAEEAHRP